MKATLFVLVTLAVCHSAFGDTKTETVSVPMRDGINLGSSAESVGEKVGDWAVGSARSGHTNEGR